MEYAFILLFLYASYLSVEKYVHTGSVLKWRGGQRPASGLPVKEEPAEPREETSEEAVIGRSRYRLWQSPPMDEEYAMSEKRTDTTMKGRKAPVPEFPAPFGRPEDGEVPERYEITGYVERPDPHLICLPFRAKLPLQTFPHFLCRLIGKGDRRDLTGFYPLFPNQMTKPRDQGLRFSSAGSCCHCNRRRF